MNLRSELRKYDEVTVPDHLFEAWRILFIGYNPPDRQEILEYAEKELQERENRRRQRNFNVGRVQLPKRETAKWNWNSK